MDLVDDRQLEQIRAIGSALARQDGRGVRRDLLVRLAGPGRTLTILADPEPVLALIPPQRGAARIFAALTAREREVASLIVDGHRNQQIADELVISLATVKDHVHNILAKTGLTSRSALAGAWREPDQSA